MNKEDTFTETISNHLIKKNHYIFIEQLARQVSGEIDKEIASFLIKLAEKQAREAELRAIVDEGCKAANANLDF